MIRKFKNLLPLVLIGIAATVCSGLEPIQEDSADSATEEAIQLFENRVFPLLKQHCFRCHGATEKVRGGFVLTNREDLFAGGDSGEAIDSGSLLESLLVSAINYEDLEMPPAGKLPQADIDAIIRWIELGAPWTTDGVKPERKKQHSVPQVNDETKKWWSYQKPTRPAPPQVNGEWAQTNIDRFILNRLEQAELKPNPAATKQTLARRAYYDLIGLPPTAAQMGQFLNDNSPDAFENLVDQLLESPHYGEKWARHWLDLVRYAESNSYERDGTKPFVWRYRDYVIRAFNDNKPYDQFLIEQLAGDELANVTPERLIATGYYRLGRWDDEPVDPKQAWYDDMDDILATTTQSMLAMTVNCARCHDHKIDPIPQADYYRMLAFFKNVQRYGIRAHDTVLAQSTRPIVPLKERMKRQEVIDAHNRLVKQNREGLEEIESRVKEDFETVEMEDFWAEMNRVPLVRKRIGKKLDGKIFTKEEADHYEALFKEMKRLREETPEALESALCVTESGPEAGETYVLIRGNANAESKVVEPGFPSVLSPPNPVVEKPVENKTTGRRMALAKWIASSENPLTARVMVNRIWQHHFGRGIVRSANDFGFQGTKPTHPELLDWLAVEFMESGWDIKHIHRLIMNSQTYQMSSEPREGALARDPLNEHFWRFNMRRLTAEEIRDSILMVNRTLRLDKMYGPSVYPTIPPEVLHGQSRPGENWNTSSAEEQARRSVYIHIKRSLPVPMLANFDAADPDSSCAVRFNTVQPTQALGMLNSTFINEEAAKFADSIVKEIGDNLVPQIELALTRVLQRVPSKSEIKRGENFVSDLQKNGTDKKKALQLFCVVALNLNEFLYLD